MQHIFKLNRTSREMISSFFENYTLYQLKKIPSGYSNNLIWNIAHLVVVQQVLVYKLSGLSPLISDDLIEKYKKGTLPVENVTQSEVDEIKSLLFKTIDKTEEDFKNNVFKKFTPYTTSTGFVLNTIEDALIFNSFHEGIHIGVIMGLKKHL